MKKRQQGTQLKYKPAGKHSKSIKKIVKLIESIGFEFVKQSNKVHFKHPKRRCSIFFASSPSDQNAVRQIVRRLKKDLLNCEPPIDVNSLPSGKNLNQLRLTKGIGSLSSSLTQLDDEPTMGDELDACVEDNFSRISTEMNADAKESLKMLSEQKGITMGELIEEMMEVYQKHQ
jgi:predicted RNA binding protein YcfA (HicA-like mRNA interferase family)